MSYKLKLLPEALVDIKESIEWYNEQKAGLGSLFYRYLNSRLNYIKKNPLHYQVSYRDVRNALLQKFPYQVHYRLDQQTRSIIVLAVTHTSRSPRVWKDR